MNRDTQSAILKACARFLSKRLEPIEQRIKAVETKEIPPPVIKLDDVVKEILSTDELKTLVDLHVAEAVAAGVAKHFVENPIRQPEDGKPGERGEKGEPGRDGLDVKDLFRADGGRLVAVMSDGTTKDLGQFVGENGKDGLSVTDLTREYLPDSHEIVERWTQAGQSKELRYPAGGIHHGGYWMNGVKAAAGQSWTHNGTLWIAVNDTADEPSAASKDWTIGARKGRDGQDGKIIKVPQEPVKLGGKDGK